MVKYFTLVLDGHAKLAAARFAPTMSSRELELLARESLKKHGANYMHGTSHGVGSFLNVHETPPVFGIDRLEPGMCLSNEPGYYEEGEFGIRIESVVVVFEVNKELLGLETLNYIPIQAKLITEKLLSETARTWLNDYHKQCFEKVGPKLKEMKLMDVYNWLEDATKPI